MPVRQPGPSLVLRNVLANVPGQDVVDEGLISHTASACFLTELIEDAGVDTNRNQLARLVAKRRAADAPHGLQSRPR